MKERYCDIFIIGAGAAGMAAALSACASGASVILCEQEETPGGILNRCIHHGFGLLHFGEDLTGLEYADRFRKLLAASTAVLLTGTTVLSIAKDRSAILTSDTGITRVHFDSCILASGSSERTYSSVPVTGTRPCGILTAGCLQELMNTGGYDIGKRIVILGSGNVGQIMGRQLIQAGKEVIAMIEQGDRPGGLARNRRECIEAYHIPLRLHSTVTEIHGTGRLAAVTVKDLLTGEEERIACDTLITAIGLLPERSLALPLMKDGLLPPWLRLAGNCERIHDIADSAAAQGKDTAQELISAIRNARGS